MALCFAGTTKNHIQTQLIFDISTSTEYRVKRRLAWRKENDKFRIHDSMYDLFIYCYGSRHLETENLAPEQDSRFRESGLQFCKTNETVSKSGFGFVVIKHTFIGNVVKILTQILVYHHIIIFIHLSLPTMNNSTDNANAKALHSLKWDTKPIQ